MGKSRLILLKYNNYYNRIIKRTTLEDYYNYAISYLDNINFNPNDGIHTEQVINWESTDNPDYIVVLNETNTLESRWFVVDSVRLRNGQFKMTLRRDIITDNYNEVINAPCYIEKATVTDIEDPAVYNSENLSLNQIKKSEVLLKDKTTTNWLVGWIDCTMTNDEFKSLFKNSDNSPKTINYGKGYSDYTTSDISTFDKYNNKTYVALVDGDTYVQTMSNLFAGDESIYDYKRLRFDANGVGKISTKSGSVSSDYNFSSNSELISAYANMKTHPNTFKAILQSIPNVTYKSTDQYNAIILDKNKIIYDSSTNKYYQITLSVDIDDDATNVAITTSIGQIYRQYGSNTKPVRIGWRLNQVTCQLVEVARSAGSLFADVENINPSTSQMNDGPYMGFCIPYDDIRVYDESIKWFRRDSNMASAQLMSKCLQDGKYLYDLQLLPYCPCFNNDGIKIHTSALIRGTVLKVDDIPASRKIKFYKDSQYHTKSDEYLVSEGYIFFSSSFDFDIKYSIPDCSDSLEKKLRNCTEMYRISSPNYSSYFEFSPYKNNGVSLFNVDCTYKPYKSYIHINPNFSGLYGQDFNDSRGLVITSDFSIPQTNDAWESYQISNKNYAQVFERQIQNMEFQNKWNLAESFVNASAGAMGGIGAGAMLGGPQGAVVGGLASSVGGALDVFRTYQTQKETMDYTKDMYNLNLQNIQALPNTLCSVSSFDANNKMYPFVEVYKCTDTEYNALKDKLKYDGWNINRVSTIANFIVSGELTYIKGKLIRLEDTNTDYHEVVTIAEELNKGVFI